MSPFKEGYNAFCQGIACSECPYDYYEMDNYLEWQSGWANGCRDAEEKEYFYES